MSREVVSTLDTDWYRCAKCEKSYFVKSADADKHLLKRSMRCPNYVRCKGKIVQRSWKNAGEVRNYYWVTALELYQAAAGLGLLSERNCSPLALKKILVGHKALAIEVSEAGDPNKSILTSITLDNGKVIHLAASTKGAIVYKVTEANGVR
jgi:DNA-directed RNA polymerase subunit RPC12/RpoP